MTRQPLPALAGHDCAANPLLMAYNDDDFRPRLRKSRGRGNRPMSGRRVHAASARPATFMGEVHQAIRRAGGDPNRPVATGTAGRRFNSRRRGASVALALKRRSAGSQDGRCVRTRARRVGAVREGRHCLLALRRPDRRQPAAGCQAVKGNGGAVRSIPDRWLVKPHGP